MNIPSASVNEKSKREREEESWKWRRGKHIVAMGRPLSHHYQNGKRLCKRHAARGTEQGQGQGQTDDVEAD